MKELWNLRYGLIWSEEESEDMFNHVLELTEQDVDGNYIYHIDKVDTPYYTFAAPSYWDVLELKYNIKFKLDDGSFRPVNEWLDDLYLQCPSRCLEMLEDIMLHGDELFKDLIKHKQ